MTKEPGKRAAGGATGDLTPLRRSREEEKAKWRRWAAQPNRGEEEHSSEEWKRAPERRGEQGAAPRYEEDRVGGEARPNHSENGDTSP